MELRKKEILWGIGIIIFVVLSIGGAIFGYKRYIRPLILENNVVMKQNENRMEVEKKHAQFISSVSKPAVTLYKQNHQVLPSIVISQAILESQWGESKLYQKANNPFGIKGAYHGQSITYETNEYENNKQVKIKSDFRKYPNLEDAIADHNNQLNYNFIKTSKPLTYQQTAHSLQQNNYATDPDYASKLTSVIKHYNLNQYDKTASNQKAAY